MIARVLGLDVEKDEELEIARQLVDVGLGELLPYSHLRLHPALAPLLRRELSEAELEEARRAWMGAMVALAEDLYQQRFQAAQLASTLTVFELPNLLGALELLEVSSGAEEVVDVATTLEGLFQNLGRPRLMARVVRIREVASAGLRELTAVSFRGQVMALERLFEAGRHEEAVQAAQALLHRVEVTGEETYQGAPYDLAMAHLILGRALVMAGAAEAALGSLAEAKERFHKLGGIGDRDAADMAMERLSDVAICLANLGRFDQAAETNEVCIQLAEDLGNQRGAAVAKLNLGSVRMRQKRYYDALRILTDALKTFELLGEPAMVAGAWHQIGRVHEATRQYEAAEHAYRQALKIRVQLGDRPGEAATLNQLGNLYGCIGFQPTRTLQ